MLMSAALFVIVITACLIAALRWGFEPLAQTVSGRATDFKFNLSVNVNIVLSITTVMSVAYGAIQHRAVRRHKAANQTLRAELGV